MSSVRDPLYKQCPFCYHPYSLIKQNKSYIQDIHSERSVNEFVKIIQKTDFDGVSGRINFVNNQHSRLSNVKV